MGKYRTLPHLNGFLLPNTSSACYGNAQRGSKESSGNFLPALKKSQWAKRKKSSLFSLDRVQNFRLILFFAISLLTFQQCASASIDAVSVSTGDVIVTDSSASGGSNSSQNKELTAFISQEPLRNCTPPSSEEFPADLFTKEQRQHGAIAIHFFALCYMLYALLIVCDAYFVPAIECICQELRIAPNVAGATFMAISTSAPELFTNVIGTFVTQGDLGVGTIVGSAVFNVLAVGFCVGIGTNFAVKNMPAGVRNKRKGVPLDWWSLSRDTAYYMLSVGILLGVLYDGRVYWYESVTMIAVYGLYIAGMCYDTQCKEFMETVLEKVWRIFAFDDHEPRRKLSKILQQKFEETGDETSPLIYQDASATCYGTGHAPKKQSHRLSIVDVLTVPNELFDSSSLSSSASDSSDSSITSSVATLEALKDIVAFPMRLALSLTVPDCRKEKMKKWCGVSLLCCVGWIAGLSYIISWMVCVIGETFGIPDSVSGLTFLAAGTSLPEILSSVIVARQGKGSMGLSNSVGSNTFDILICLGLPWLIQSLILTSNVDDFISIHSAGLEYSVILLVTSMIILYFIIAANGYVLDTKVGVVCLAMYTVFITLACLLEMNIFFPVNLPVCQSAN